MHRPPSQHDHLARLSCSQASPRCGRGSSASGHQHRTAARCSCRMETAVRSAWIGSATIAHVSKTPLLPRHGGLAQCGKIPSPAHRYFRPCGCSRLCLFPWHRRPGSHVPYESLRASRRLHARCRSGSLRHPHELIPKEGLSPGSFIA